MWSIHINTGDKKGPIGRRVNLTKCEDGPVNIRDVCDTKSPVKGGARSSVEDAWDATDLSLEIFKK